MLHLSTLPIILYESRNEELTREIMTKTFSNPDTTSLRQLPTTVHWLVHATNRNGIGRALHEPLTRCPATSFFNYYSQLLLEFIGEAFLAKQGEPIKKSIMEKLPDWSRPFCLVAVMIDADKSSAAQMISYQALIACLHQDYPGKAWLVCDRVFRPKMAASKKGDWDQINHDFGG